MPVGGIAVYGQGHYRNYKLSWEVVLSCALHVPALGSSVGCLIEDSEKLKMHFSVDLIRDEHL